MLDEKHRLHRAYSNDPKSIAKKNGFGSRRCVVQQKLCQIQDTWLSQNFADRHDIKNFYCALKAIYGPTASWSAPLLCADGSRLITERENILERWAEHFDGVLNRPSSINEEAIQRLPVAINESLAEPPTVSKTIKSIELLSSEKAPGADSIPAEVYKAGGPILAEKLTELLCIRNVFRKITRMHQ
jgi:hypothetical protein